VTPGLYPLNLYRGDTYAWRFRCWQDEAKTVPADLAGVTPKAEIREKSGSLVLVTMECTVELPGVIYVEFPAEAWATWTKATKAMWDLQLTYIEGEVITIIAGPVKITGDITDSSALAAMSAITR
jgi:hypothetical protein